MIRVNGNEIKLNQFPDGTYALKSNDWEFLKRGEPENVEWFYESEAEMSALLYVVRHLQKASEKVNLLIPYLPNARMDRVKSNHDVFTLKYFCEFINFLRCNSVAIIDPHSSVSEALIDNLKVCDPTVMLAYALEDVHPDMLFFPDEGAMKRYTDLYCCKRFDFAFGMKDRDWATGKIKGLEVFGSDVKDKNILIVDDICSRGGTFYHSAKKLKELGAKSISLYVTHCENTILEGEVLTSGLIDKVYTTNSIFTKEHEKVEVMYL